VLEDFTAQLQTGLVFFIFGAAVCTVVEAVFAGEKQTIRSRLRGFSLYLFLITSGAFAAMLMGKLARDMWIVPLLRLDLTAAPISDHWLWSLLGYALFPFLGVVVSEFVFYFFHRLQHTVPLLWHFHKVHHSIEELNAFNNYHHVAEAFVRIPLMTIPIALFIDLSVPKTTITTVLIVIASHIPHANTKIRYGIFRYFLSEPRYHRIHHSIEAHHQDKNFAFVFPIWDVLFGTAYFPARDEYPKTGLAHMREPKTIWQYLFPQISG